MGCSEAPGTERVRGVDRQQRVAGLLHHFKKVSFESLYSREFAQTYFGGNLPRRCRGYENHIERICHDFRCLTA